MNRSFNEILDNCINLIKHGEENVDGCLARYPEYSEELKSLLNIFIATGRVPKPKPSAQFKHETRERLLKRAKSIRTSSLSLNQIKRKKFLSLKPAFVQIAAMVLIVVLLSGGAAMASTNSLPGDLLYPLKITTEKVQLSLAFTEMTKARLHLKFAERRLEEVKILTYDRKEVELANIINSMTEHLNKAMSLVNKMPKERREEMLLEISQFVQREQKSLQEAVEKASSEDKKTIKDTIEATREDGSEDGLKYENSETETKGKEEKTKEEFHDAQGGIENNSDDSLSDINDASSGSESRNNESERTDFMKESLKR